MQHCQSCKVEVEGRETAVGDEGWNLNLRSWPSILFNIRRLNSSTRVLKGLRNARFTAAGEVARFSLKKRYLAASCESSTWPRCPTSTEVSYGVWPPDSVHPVCVCWIPR